MESRYGRTEFAGYTHAQLVEMLAAGRPGEVELAAEGWRALSNRLDDVALAIEQQNTAFRGLWEGGAAANHAGMIASLIDGVRRVAWTARRIGDQVSAAAEALRRAQEKMAALGPPLDLRPPDQAVVAAASAPLPYGDARAEAAARQGAAYRAIQDFRRTQATAGATAAAAAAILDELRNAYLNAELPPPPAVAEPPTLAADGTPVFPPAAASNGTPPVFTDMWRNGLSAAAGMPPAQILQPYLPGQPPGPGAPPAYPPLPGADPIGSSPRLSDVGGSPPLGGAFPGGSAGGGLPGSGLPGAGSFAGGGFPGGGFPGDDVGAGPEQVRAVGQSSLAPAISPVKTGDGGNGMGMGMGMMPPMMGGFMPPMGGAGAGGMGGGGVAAWLVAEVEEFGVRTPVVPEVVEA